MVFFGDVIYALGLNVTKKICKGLGKRGKMYRKFVEKSPLCVPTVNLAFMQIFIEFPLSIQQASRRSPARSSPSTTMWSS